jgi:hypothetical protein
MHASEQGMQGVVVVVDLDAGLAGKGERDPAALTKTRQVRLRIGLKPSQQAST